MTLSIILIVLITCLTGCISAKDKKSARSYQKNAIKITNAYIEDKYNFTPQIINATNIFDDSYLFAHLTNYVLVEFTNPEVSASKEITSHYAYVNASTDTYKCQKTECYDNYQMHEIESSIKNIVNNSEVDGIKHLELSYGHFATTKTNPKRYGLVHKKYTDTDSLLEILSEAPSKIAIGTVTSEADIKSLENHMLNNFYCPTQSLHNMLTCLIINYRNTADYNKAKESMFDIIGHPIDSNIEKYAIYISNYSLISTDKDENIKHCKYLLYTYKDNFYYILTDTPNNSYCNITNLSNSTNTALDESAWHGHGILNPQKIFGDYELNTNAEKVLLFIPIDRLDYGNHQKIKLCVLSNYNTHPNYKAESTGMLGENTNYQYLTAVLYNNTQSNTYQFTFCAEP